MAIITQQEFTRIVTPSAQDAFTKINLNIPYFFVRAVFLSTAPQQGHRFPTH